MWTTTLQDLKPGAYEVRARSVDQSGFAQPEPRPQQATGRNAILDALKASVAEAKAEKPAEARPPKKVASSSGQAKKRMSS